LCSSDLFFDVAFFIIKDLLESLVGVVIVVIFSVDLAVLVERLMLADGLSRCIVEGICFGVLGLKMPLSGFSQYSILINVDHILKVRIGLIELGGFPMLDPIYKVFDLENLVWHLLGKAQELSMEHTIDNLHFGLLISIMINGLFSLVQDVKFQVPSLTVVNQSSPSPVTFVVVSHFPSPFLSK